MLYRTKIALATVLILLLLAPTAFASQLDAKRQELKSIDAQIKATKNQRNDAAKREATLRRQIEASNQKLVQMQTKLNKLQTELNSVIARKRATEAKLQQTQLRLEVMQGQLAAAQKRLALRREAFNKRLISSYKNRKQSALTVLLSSEDFSDFMTRISLLRLIAENDGRLVLDMKQLTASISSEIAQVEAMKLAIDKQRQQLVAEKKRMDAVMNSVIAQQEDLEAEAAKQQRLYAQIQEEQERLARAESRLRANASEVEGQIDRLQGGSARAASIPKDLKPLARQTAEKYGIPANIFFALITQESGWNYRAVSRAGAIGLTQVMPFNVIAMGYSIESFKDSPADQLEAGARYLSQQYKTFGRWDLALAAYNAGPGAVLRYGGIPPYQETQNYVRSILAMAA